MKKALLILVFLICGSSLYAQKHYLLIIKGISNCNGYCYDGLLEEHVLNTKQDVFTLEKKMRNELRGYPSFYTIMPNETAISFEYLESAGNCTCKKVRVVKSTSYESAQKALEEHRNKKGFAIRATFNPSN
ncbi:hypothetical protein SAMN03080617_00348 [Algoriphagus alkaliphilus]|uniref:Uncharacterized protein n=1 Tax=Algoriphagus alkaliphilus TaxID=279824 RepID=A0A1G5V941_9BACT|nr:hypothetical protein [Algoriphagus alkaliphilus]MBA4300879.1 hypothetical protein [Cyclobacterium sp.]SDA42158.1 hypothetical protein SAMN03080617_00348 [Algoriphagus alkaliphilus]